MKSNDCVVAQVLHLSAAGGHLPVVQYLIDRRADVNRRDSWNDTPLSLAASCTAESPVQVLPAARPLFRHCLTACLATVWPLFGTRMV